MFKTIHASRECECALVRAFRIFAKTLKLQKEWRGKKELSQTTQFSCICQSESHSRPLKLQKEWHDKKELSQPPSFLSWQGESQSRSKEAVISRRTIWKDIKIKSASDPVDSSKESKNSRDLVDGSKEESKNSRDPVDGSKELKNSSDQH